ncbi:MAG: hypothetical protein JNK05_34675 [Myxococcales bacterium]|nr:hypothetical protein [Myxococcales bacterium]
MNRTIALASLFALLALHCAPVEWPANDGAVADAVDSAVDAAPTDARSPTDSGAQPSDAAVDARALEPLPYDSRCDALDQLALEANRVADAQVLTYERSGLATSGNSHTERCGDSFDQSGDDVSLRFTAPRSGSWRFVASGRGIGSLRVRRACASTGECIGVDALVRGPDAAPTLVREMSLQQGETVELTADGCALGGRCPAVFRAERWGPLQCFAQACPANHECVVESPERARVSCRPTIDLREARSVNVRSISAQLDAQSRHFVFDLELDPGSFWYLTIRVDRWLLADGTFVTSAPGNYTIFSVDMRDGHGAPTTVAVPDTRFVGAEFALLGSRFSHRALVRFTEWRRPALGERCSSSDAHLLCVAGTRCDASTDRCVQSERLEITSAQVFRAAGEARLRGVVRGVRGASGTTVSVAALDERGVWRSAPYGGYVGGSRDLRTEFVTELNAVLPEGRYSHARISLNDGASSAPVIVEVVEPRRVGASESCQPVDAECEPGLECVSASTGRRCEPRTMRDPCVLDPAPWAVQWTPRADTSEIEATGYGGISQLDPAAACTAAPRWSSTPIDVVFVAPRAGRYRFEGRGLSELRSGSLCTQIECQGAVGWNSTLVADRVLREGERYLLSFMTFPRAGRVSVRAKRIEE